MTEVASTGGGGVFLARERDCKTRKSSGGASRRRHAPLLDPVRRTTNAAGQLPPFVHSGCWRDRQRSAARSAIHCTSMQQYPPSALFPEYRASGARARRACPFLPTAPGVDSRVLARPRCGVSCAVTRRENNTGHDVPTAAFLIGANVKVKLEASWHGSI